jgi:hypothetical protein
MEQEKSKFVSDVTVLGKDGGKFSLSYETITFLDNGCFHIYEDGTLTIEYSRQSKGFRSMSL